MNDIDLIHFAKKKNTVIEYMKEKVKVITYVFTLLLVLLLWISMLPKTMWSCWFPEHILLLKNCKQ